MKTQNRVYDSYNQAKKAVADLEAAGVPHANISLVANQAISARHDDVDEMSSTATGASIGAAVGGGAGLLAGLGMMAIPGVGPVVAAGWLAATAAGALAGSATGGLIGALVGAGESEDDAHVYSEAVRRGGTLLSVRYDEAHASRVTDILNGYKPVDPKSRRAEYASGGWKQFDDKAESYKMTDEDKRRMQRD